MPVLEINGEQIPYEIRRNRRSKRLRISVAADSVVATAPPGIPDAEIAAFLQEKAAWVRKSLARQADREAERRNQRWPLANDSLVQFRGRQIPLKLGTDVAWPGVLEQDVCRLALPADSSETLVRRYLKELIISDLDKRLPELAAPWLQKLAAVRPDITVAGYRLKDTKRQWGSCNSKGVIQLNWRLAIATDAVLEYVLVHELCHLLERNHSPRFWQHVEFCLPDYRERQAVLRSQELMLASCL